MNSSAIVVQRKYPRIVRHGIIKYYAILASDIHMNLAPPSHDVPPLSSPKLSSSSSILAAPPPPHTSPSSHPTRLMVAPRIPTPHPLPSPPLSHITATTLPAAITQLSTFLRSHSKTLLLSGAGLSTSSGLSDYRGKAGTYSLKRTYRPIFYGEFCRDHEGRKRYWARSFLGWPVMGGSKSNKGHWAVGGLWEAGKLGMKGKEGEGWAVVTQSK